jgi:uncharacterized protein (DUF433 family)
MDYIARIPLLCGGAPTLPNQRLTVYDVVSHIKLNSGYQDYAHEFDVPLHVIKAAITYCSLRRCITEKTSQNTYCDGCVLRSQVEDMSYLDDLEETVLGEGRIITKYEGGIFFGTKEQFIQEEIGVPGWEMAEELIFTHPELMV